MKRFVATLLILFQFTQPLLAEDDLTKHMKVTDSLYRQGAGAEDGGYTGIALAMFGWGIGLAAGIAILCGVLHQSTAHSD